MVIELSQQKLLRAAYSERQLQEVLVDFWFNHFNVDARKGADRFLLTEYERETIRPHVLGRFRDLLGATAKSPAMLFYLDNWMSADPNGPHADARGDASRVNRSGRERFGGRFRQNATSASRAEEERAEGPQRELRARADGAAHARRRRRLHAEGRHRGGARVHRLDDSDAAARRRLPLRSAPARSRREGRARPRIKAGGGEGDGEQVLDILARHPSTARFIATKLVRRFVSDTPPPALVDRAAARFRQTDGDLREVMRTILTSPEFLSPEAYGAKTKTPLEFVVSAVSATAGTAIAQDALPLVRAAARAGHAALLSASRRPATRTPPTRG